MLERDEFYRMMRTTGGRPYADRGSAYHDFKLLIVNWLAKSAPAEIRAEFHRAGLRGDPYSRGLHEAAKRALAIHRNSHRRRT